MVKLKTMGWVGLLGLLLSVFTVSAEWTVMSLPNLDEAWGGTSLDHLPDGRFFFAQSGQFVLQDSHGSPTWAEFLNEPSDTDPSFIAIWSTNLAVAGRGGWSDSDLDRFNPTQPTNAAFTPTGVAVGNYHGVFRDAFGVYVGGGSPHSLRYLSLNGATNVVIIADISTYSCGFARDGGGNLYVGDNDNGKVYFFTAAQLGAAITGTPLSITNGTFIHDFGGGGDLGSLAVDGFGRLWASGWQHNGLLVFNPLIQKEFTYAPLLDNSDYKVAAFTTTNGHFMGFLNQAASYANGSAQFYGYDAIGTYATYAPYGGAYGPDDGGLINTSALIKGWAVGCFGYTNPLANSGGYNRDNSGATNSTVSHVILGAPSGFTMSDTTRHVLSLGDGGSIVLTFADALADGPGPDFAVFENGFTDNESLEETARQGSTSRYTFAELAWVEVATTTNHWARFPIYNSNTSLVYNHTDTSSNLFGSLDVTLVNGAAGKHTIAYGTPFDLAMLATDPAVQSGLVDLQRIVYVRLTDIVGDGSVTDALGRAIYDPYYDVNTGYPNRPPASSIDGFDLRGVAALNFAEVKLGTTVDAESQNLSFFAGQSYTYQVESASRMSGPWTNHGPAITGSHALIELPKPSAENALFYRVQRYQP